MNLSICHTTRYRYEQDVIDSVNELRIQPISDFLQKCTAFQINLQPSTACSHYLDFYNNQVNVFEVSHPHRTLTIEACSEIETQPDSRPQPSQHITLDALQAHPSYDDYYEFLIDSTYIHVSPAIWRQAIDITENKTDLVESIMHLMHWVYQHFEYNKSATHVGTNAEQAFALRKGVCQDYAHVLIALGRALNIPFRYVSGYFWTADIENDPSSGASHAWTEAYIPDFGWLALDPTHNRLVDERYVKIAIGRDYNDARPISGTYRGTPNREMEVTVTVKQNQ